MKIVKNEKGDVVEVHEIVLTPELIDAQIEGLKTSKAKLDEMIADLESAKKLFDKEK